MYNSVKVERKHIKVPFTIDEINLLWKNVDTIPFADMILVGIYTGFRPVELTMLKTEDVHLSEGYMVDGTKTKAGKNRIVPIHPMIEEIITRRCHEMNEYLFFDYDMFEHTVSLLNYEKYRGRFEKSDKSFENETYSA